MYRARDELENRKWLADLDAAVDALDLDPATRDRAADLFLSTAPENDRSKPAVLAASLYAAGLVAGDRRSQAEIADAVGVARLTIQHRWRDLLDEAGLEPPEW